MVLFYNFFFLNKNTSCVRHNNTKRCVELRAVGSVKLDLEHVLLYERDSSRESLEVYTQSSRL